MHGALTSLLLAALLAQADPIPTGGPTITVRAHTRLEFIGLERERGGVVLTVRLIDSDLEEGIADRTVSIAIRAKNRTLFTKLPRTNAAGKAQIFIPYRPGLLDLRLAYSGDQLYLASPVSLTPIDLSKESLNLKIVAPTSLDLKRTRAQPIDVTVVARKNGPATGIGISLTLQAPGKRRPAKIGRRGISDSEGRAVFSLDPGELARPGEYRIVARSSADARYNAATAHHRLRVTTAVTIGLEITPRAARQDMSVTAKGRVTDALGAVPAGIVRIATPLGTLGTTYTDRDGRYSVRLALKNMPRGRHAIRAHFIPVSGWRRASRSKPFMLKIEPKKPIPLSYYIVPAAVTLVILLVVLIIRRRPWETLRQRLDEKRARKKEKALAGGGIELGRPSSLRALISVDDRTITGRVFDADKKKPLAGGTAQLRAANERAETLEAAVDAHGEFALTEVPSGDYALTVGSPGYVPTSIDVKVPHRGELRGLTVHLVSVREWVMRIFARLAGPLVPREELLRYWTVAEASRHILDELTSPPIDLDQLARHVEETYYSARTPSPDAIGEAERLSK